MPAWLATKRRLPAGEVLKGMVTVEEEEPLVESVVGGDWGDRRDGEETEEVMETTAQFMYISEFPLRLCHDHPKRTLSLAGIPSGTWNGI